MAGVDILASAMSGANAAYLADTYARWAENPASVDPSFAELFAALNDDAKAVLTDAMGASWAPGPRGGFAPARTPGPRRRVPSRPPLLSLPTPTPSARRHWIPCAR
jgi:2-oxoglutarate dehydrogenase E1 component